MINTMSVLCPYLVTEENDIFLSLTTCGLGDFRWVFSLPRTFCHVADIKGWGRSSRWHPYLARAVDVGFGWEFSWNY